MGKALKAIVLKYALFQDLQTEKESATASGAPYTEKTTCDEPVETQPR